MLLRCNADANKANDSGSTPLLLASLSGHCDVVKALLRAGADLTLSWLGQTPLDCASSNGHADVVGILLAAAAVEVAHGHSLGYALQRQLVVSAVDLPVEQQAADAVEVEALAQP